MKPPKKNPCGSCPYRKDVPSGVWDVSEYAKLPHFDAPTIEQPLSVFLCHQQDDTLCSGWVGCHDMDNMLGIRIATSNGHLVGEDLDAVLDYESPVPLFESGQEAAEHGMREIENPTDRASKVIRKLIRKGKVSYGTDC